MLKVAEIQKLGPRAIIYYEYFCISDNELMHQIHENNLMDKMSFEWFKKDAKIISRPIRSRAEAVSNAVKDTSDIRQAK